MTPVHAQFLGALAVSAGLLFAMVWLAARMGLRCPACGRIRRHGVCGCS
jgi:hypothetical protein